MRFPVLEQLAVRLGGALVKSSRSLEARELEIVEPVFRDSIRYDDVRVVQGYFVNAPTTLGNHIRVGLDGAFDDSTLVHEMTHVWQYQTSGGGYISDSICAQLWGIVSRGTRNAAYEVQPAELRELASFRELSAERQARTVEHYFVSTLLRSGDPAQQKRARTEFRWRFSELTDPTLDQVKFDTEYVELERMIAEIRRA